jgi:AraC-like DNA-binding protein
LTRRQQLEVWRHVAGDQYEISFDDPDVDAFSLDYARFQCGPLVLSRYRRGPALSVRTPRLIRRSDPDLFHIQFALQGRSVGNADGADFNGADGGFLFMDMSRPLEITSAGETEVVAFFLRRDRLTEFIPHAWKLHGVVGGTSVSEVFKDHLLSLMRHASAITPQTAVPISDGMVRLLSAAVAPSAKTFDEASAELNAGLLRRAKQFIGRELLSPELTPDRIALAIGVSRRKLYYLFEPEGGVARCVQRQRLERAREALANPAQGYRVKEAAFDHGFASEAHFSRSFKRQFGVNASEVAELVRLSR